MSNQYSSELPTKIFAEAVVRSVSGESLLRSSRRITSKNVTLFHAPHDRQRLAASRLRAAGFEVLDIGKTSINIAAPPEVYERSFAANLEQIERPVIWGEQSRISSFINSVDQTPFGEIDISDTHWNNILDGVSINQPAYYQQIIPSATPPQTNTRYLQIPNELAEELGARLAHEQGITGKGVKVVVVDSGCYVEHPFFKQHQYKLSVLLGPGSTRPDQDNNGHGTGIAANVLAIAPDVDLTVVKADVALENRHRNVNSIAAFRKAVSLRPNVISCSWGSDLRSPYYISSFHKVLAAAIADAVREGIVVVFSAGNGQWGFPAQHPDVIAVGGAYKHLEGSFKGRVEASNYASGFASLIYQNRNVPDVCGLVGKLPNAAYVMLPVPPGSEIDRRRSVMGDETGVIDGWAAFSGTSSAAPQVAGACALLEQFAPGLSPAKVKDILRHTAINIVEGNSNPASGSAQARDDPNDPDFATGSGLVDAYKAIQELKEKQGQQSQNLTTSFSEPSVLTAYTRDINPRPNLGDSLHIKQQRIANTMSLDESTLRKLRKELDEIQIELNLRFKEKFKELADENVELVIDEGNFVESTSESEAISSLRNILRKGGKRVRKEAITKKHISAAESLLRRGKCQDLVKEILVDAMSLTGKSVKYTVEIEGQMEEVSHESNDVISKFTSINNSWFY
jgi:serine protease AprX